MTQITLIGNMTSAAELRFTQNGKAVASVTVAVNRKKGDTEETDFHRVTIWEGMAEHAAELDKGTRVIVVGRLVQRPWKTKEGEQRTSWEVTADAFGPDLRFAKAQVQKVAKGQSGDMSWNTPQPPAADVWSQGGGGSYGEDAPF